MEVNSRKCLCVREEWQLYCTDVSRCFTPGSTRKYDETAILFESATAIVDNSIELFLNLQ